MTRLLKVVPALAGLAWASGAAAAPLPPLARFGLSVSISGDTAVVGARDEEPSGAVYVYTRSGQSWTEQQRLVRPPSDTGQFGAAVAVSGDTLVVGSPRGAADAGSAYVYVRAGATWSVQQRLFAPDLRIEDEFGIPLSISGDTLVVGAYCDDTVGGVDAGSAYVFTRSGTAWSQQQKLTASDGAANDFFGIAVAVAGDTLVIGAAVADTPAGIDTGAAYVFTRTGTVWSERQKLTASDAAASDFFGGSVGISGDTVAVGAMLHDGSAGSNAGAAYVFERSLDAWSERQKLTASDPSAWAQLGNSLSLAGETLVVGALADRPVPGGAAGSAYVYVRAGTSWTEQAKLRASGGAGGDDFGVSVSLAGDTALIGNSLDDTVDGTDAGSASVRVRAGSSWSEQQLLPPAVPAGLYTLPPCRVVDTRTTASPLRGNSIAAFPVAGRCLVPGDARAVVAIFTAVGPTQAGNLRLFPDDQIAPLASALNFAAGQTRAGNGVVLLGRDGNVAVQCDMPPGAPGQTHFVLDVVAYFR